VKSNGKVIVKVMKSNSRSNVSSNGKADSENDSKVMVVVGPM
jgi:hypothetical protein